MSQNSNAPPTPDGSPVSQDASNRRYDPTRRQQLHPSNRTPLTPYHEGEPPKLCLCPVQPKIRRPPNSFMLYRKACQSKVRHEHPTATNPEISKIIGQLWHRESPEVQAHFKAHAERAKAQHQKDYPEYRFQPKRRRSMTSLEFPSPFVDESAKCDACGGVIKKPSLERIGSQGLPISISIPSSVFMGSSPSHSIAHDSQHRARHDISPILGRTQQVLQNPQKPRITPRDETCSILEHKRRRLDSPPATVSSLSLTSQRQCQSLAAQQEDVCRTAVRTWAEDSTMHSHSGPQSTQSTGISKALRTANMIPKMNSHNGSSDCRDHLHGRDVYRQSLTLPPLQFIDQVPSMSDPQNSAASGFRHKLGILRQIAPPSEVNAANRRGPLIVIEGDDAQAARRTSCLVRDELCKDESLEVRVLDGPVASSGGHQRSMMAQYHRLVAEWLHKSDEISRLLALPQATEERSTTLAVDESPSLGPAQSASTKMEDPRITARDASNLQKPLKCKYASVPVVPVVIIPNYSLHATNVFSRNIPLPADDPYQPTDHWQWTATQWRGIVSADLTIYVRSAGRGERPTLEAIHDRALFIVHEPPVSQGEVLPETDAMWRRLRLEINEWIRRFSAQCDDVVLR